MTGKRKNTDTGRTLDLAKRRAQAGLDAARGLRIKRSYVWATVFTLLITVWLATGQISGSGSVNSESLLDKKPAGPAIDDKAFQVRVREFTAQKRDAAIVLRGRTEAEARVDVQAETQGTVEKLEARKGAFVTKDTPLCVLEKGVREAVLAKAKAEVSRAELDLEASEKLMAQGHTARLKVAEQRANLDAARASLEQAEIDIKHTVIRAPFDGVVEAQPAKVGDFLITGKTCATMVALDPLVVVGTVSEHSVGKLRVGMTGQAKLVTGESVQGRIRFIATAADPATRTFRVEMEVPNADRALRDGVTADISIPVKSEMAHRIPPAVLGLDDSGRIGVRMVVNGGTVRFAPVKIVSNSSEGVWISGLPDSVTLITVGQEYVVDG
ncbi:MAG: efflux RND transporter periplasmic adaptor subunit, partial [Pseudomonadota bacterium]|nr:efflux RND transporter periplasmic adaptor subunit [Pseudomonadota bacterium]